MNRARPLSGWLSHVAVTLHLSFRHPQAIIYAYLVPVIFLLAFGAVFRSGDPPLLDQMGQMMTITILGGACFGLPTTLVAERERGIWRRYRLLPLGSLWLVLGTMTARVVIVASSVLMQMALAGLFFGTPTPRHPLEAAVALLFVILAFLGLGLLIAALADTVPAVQALGQCLFLPMIMIGGVGVPLSVLPLWAQRVAGFLPGRYAVELLQPCFNGPTALSGSLFRFLALAVIGLAAALAGARLFRWQPGPRPPRSLPWTAAAFASWALVGAVAWTTGQLRPVFPESAAWTEITEAQIAAIAYDGLPADGDIIATLAPASLDTPESRALRAQLDDWRPARLDDAGQSIRHLVALAAIADLSADPREAALARVVFHRLRSAYDPAVARQALAWIILSPDDGTVIRKAPELALHRHPPERLVRQRSVIYAQKYLGRLTGKLPD